ncbi:ligand-gated ion channel 4-like [Palaemon carinicauda]|uniref:ligand-gated ion channel 4-like n=1 Tax=Palaemon carinicauda TaxID=392227 RepID=UPI0035B64ADA
MYYGVTICRVRFASGMSVLTLNIHHRAVRGTEVPHITKKIVLGGLSKLVFLHFKIPVMAQEGRNILLNDMKPDLTPCFTLQDLRPEPTVRLDSITTEKFHLHEMDNIEHFNVSPRFTPRRNVPSNNDAPSNTSSAAGQLSDFEYQLLRVLNKVYQTIEKNEMRLGEHDRKEATLVEWQQGLSEHRLAFPRNETPEKLFLVLYPRFGLVIVILFTLAPAACI